MAPRIREVGDLVEVLSEICKELDALSRSDLNTLNHVLMNSHSQVVREITRRKLGKGGQDFGTGADEA